MYAVGETFYYDIDEHEEEFEVLGDLMLKGKEYLVAEDVAEQERYVFLYDESEELLIMIEDEDVIEHIINNWEEQFYGTSNDMEFWDDENYYEREDQIGAEEEYDELESFGEFEEDEESFFGSIVEKEDEATFYGDLLDR